MKFNAIFKKRFLVTPQTSMPEQKGGKNKAAKAGKIDEMDMISDELVERLIPKIFDDVFSKNWRDDNSNIDLSIALEFVDTSYEHIYGDEPHKL